MVFKRLAKAARFDVHFDQAIQYESEDAE